MDSVKDIWSKNINETCFCQKKNNKWDIPYKGKKISKQKCGIFDDKQYKQCVYHKQCDNGNCKNFQAFTKSNNEKKKYDIYYQNNKANINNQVGNNKKKFNSGVSNHMVSNEMFKSQFTSDPNKKINNMGSNAGKHPYIIKQM
jgi:hypothetical protein